MCGRYTLAADEQALVEAFDVPPLGFDLVPRYNIAPSQEAPVVAEDRKGRRAGLLTWGLVPAWKDEPGPGFINARAESVADKPSFREAFERRRCLVPADGFYEWKREGGGKVPYWFHAPGGELLAFAGVWESWSRPDAEPRHTFAILTTDANADVRGVHDRMPVVIPPSRYSAWLSRETGRSEVLALLGSPPDGTLVCHAVSTRVNRPAVDDVGLIEEV